VSGPQQLLLFAIVLVAVLSLMRLRHYRPARRQRVLDVFLRYPDAKLYGTDISRLAGLPGGSVYPELAALERDRQVLSGWEAEATTRVGPRRQYWLNPWRPEAPT
jgi:hypothetical protein